MPTVLNHDMAKKNTKKVEKTSEAPTNYRKPMVVQIRGSKEWKAWIEGMAEKEGDTVAKFIERMARKYAKEIGYPDPPKR